MHHSSLQKLLNICNNYGQANSISLNPLDSAYIVFAPIKFNLFVPDMIFNSMNLKHSFDVKYVGFRLNYNIVNIYG